MLVRHTSSPDIQRYTLLLVRGSGHVQRTARCTGRRLHERSVPLQKWNKNCPSPQHSPEQTAVDSTDSIRTYIWHVTIQARMSQPVEQCYVHLWHLSFDRGLSGCLHLLLKSFYYFGTHVDYKYQKNVSILTTLHLTKIGRKIRQLTPTVQQYNAHGLLFMAFVHRLDDDSSYKSKHVTANKIKLNTKWLC